MPLKEQELQSWLAVLRATAWLNQQLARDMLRHDRIRIHWYDVLIQLLHVPEPDTGLRMQDLIDRVIISNSGMTRLIDRLVEEGYVKRTYSEDDRREVYVTITPQGKTLTERISANHQKRLKAYFADNATDEEHRVIEAVFTRILDANTSDSS